MLEINMRNPFIDGSPPCGTTDDEEETHEEMRAWTIVWASAVVQQARDIRDSGRRLTPLQKMNRKCARSLLRTEHAVTGSSKNADAAQEAEGQGSAHSVVLGGATSSPTPDSSSGGGVEKSRAGRLPHAGPLRTMESRPQTTPPGCRSASVRGPSAPASHQRGHGLCPEAHD